MGWVNGAEAPSAEKALEAISELKRENLELQRQLTEAQHQVDELAAGKDKVGRYNFKDLVDTLKASSVKFEKGKITLYDLLLNNSEMLVRGVPRYAEDDGKVLYDEAMPQFATFGLAEYKEAGASRKIALNENGREFVARIRIAEQQKSE